MASQMEACLRVISLKRQLECNWQISISAQKTDHAAKITSLLIET